MWNCGKVHLTHANCIALATKDGSPIHNDQPPELQSNLLDLMHVEITRSFPDVILRRKSATYNCVGLCFASRRTSVEPDDIPNILRKDGYRRIFDAASLMRGDIVIYRFASSGDISHVGLVWEVRRRLSDRPLISVLSKWGQGAEYLHRMDYVPGFAGRPSEYWTDRR